jgi:hypothetical protein
MKTQYYNEYNGNPYIGTDSVDGVVFFLPLNIRQGCSYQYESVDSSSVKVEVNDDEVRIYNTFTR